jgi:hypothetical protein
MNAPTEETRSLAQQLGDGLPQIAIMVILKLKGKDVVRLSLIVSTIIFLYLC